MKAWQRYRDLLGPNPRRDLADELRFHLETETEELIAAGLEPEEARRRAVEKFGDVERYTAEISASDTRRLARRRRARFLEILGTDLQYALRGMRARPGFATMAILILALGLGANAAIFAVVDHLFFRMPAVVSEPGDLRRLWVERRAPDGRVNLQARFSAAEARMLDSSLAADGYTAGLYLKRNAPSRVDEVGSPTLRAVWATRGFLPMLGVSTHIGTPFDSASGEYGIPASAALISWSLWQRSFGGDPRVVGRVIHLGKLPVVIRGVLPRGFTGVDVDVAEIWLPLAGFPGFGDEPRPNWYRDWGTYAVQVVMRGGPDVSESRLVERLNVALHATAEAEAQARRRPGMRRVGSRAMPGSILGTHGPDGLDRGEKTAAVLAGLSLLLLIATIANVGNLLLGRALDRRREIAVRTALGMSRRRLAIQVLTEGLLFSGIATIAATAAAVWTGTALRTLLIPGTVMATGPLDVRAGIVVIALGVMTGTLVTLLPLAASLRIELPGALRAGASATGGRRLRVRSVLVGLQAAVTVLLLVGTGLLGRSFAKVRAIDLGFDPETIVIVSGEGSNDAAMLRIADLARSIPGVSDAALAAQMPFFDQFGVRHLLGRDGDTLRVGKTEVGFVAAEAAYMRVMGTRVVRGRGLTADDRAGSAPVIVVSEELARLLWKGADPIGKCFRLDAITDPCRAVVGVAENSHVFYVVEEPRATFYMPIDQQPDLAPGQIDAGALVIRAPDGNAHAVATRLKAELRDTSTTPRYQRVVELGNLVNDQYRPWRTGARLFGVLTALALFLSLLGLYAVLSYLVTLRRRELGVRIALGADRARVLMMILREAMQQLSIGAIAGLVLAFFASRALSDLLYQVSPRDPLVLTGALVVLLGAGTAAALLPARRATAIDPATALREE